MSLLAPGLAWLARVLGHWFLRLPVNFSSIKNDVLVLAAGRLDMEKSILSRCLSPFTRAHFLFFFGPQDAVFSYSSSSSGEDHNF